MELTEALEILKALADGIDPNTGEVFPDDSPYQQPKTIRALNKIVSVFDDKTIARENRPPQKNAGKPWDAHQEGILIRCFNDGKSISDIAKEFGRTSGAIRSRLERLGLIEGSKNPNNKIASLSRISTQNNIDPDDPTTW